MNIVAAPSPAIDMRPNTKRTIAAPTMRFIRWSPVVSGARLAHHRFVHDTQIRLGHEFFADVTQGERDDLARVEAVVLGDLTDRHDGLGRSLPDKIDKFPLLSFRDIGRRDTRPALLHEL